MFGNLRSKALFALLVFCTAVPCLSQDAPDHTLGLLNGRWWKKTTPEMKLGFVYGYAERRTATFSCSESDEW